MKKLHLLEFINNNSDWKEKIQLEPYHIKIKEWEDYILFEYNMAISDFRIPFVAELLPFSNEGYVVVDEDFNRVKVKSGAYVASHHLRMNGVVTEERIIGLIKTGKQDDFVSIFNEYKNDVEKVENKIKLFLLNVNNRYENIIKGKYETRKDLALEVCKSKYSGILFGIIDKKIPELYSWLLEQNEEKIYRLINQ